MQSCKRPHRSGYTLIEMLIVCAVLAAMAGMSWPAVRGMLSKGRLQKGADDVQTTLRKSRVQAIRAGEATLFQYEAGGRRFRTIGWKATMGDSNLDESAQQTAALANESAATAEQLQRLPPVISREIQELPVGVRFASHNAGSGAFAANETQFPDGSSTTSDDVSLVAEIASEPDWALPVVFQANGRSEDAEIRLVDDRGFVIDLSLRGLTGIVTATAPYRPRLENGESMLPSEEALSENAIEIGGQP